MTHKTAKTNFINSGAVDIIRIYYIHGYNKNLRKFFNIYHTTRQSLQYHIKPSLVLSSRSSPDCVPVGLKYFLHKL